MEISYQYTKMRRDFGRQPLFCEQGPELCDSIPTAIAEHKNYTLRNPVHQLTQNTPCFSSHEINTIRLALIRVTAPCYFTLEDMCLSTFCFSCSERILLF